MIKRLQSNYALIQIIPISPSRSTPSSLDMSIGALVARVVCLIVLLFLVAAIIFLIVRKKLWDHRERRKQRELLPPLPAWVGDPALRVPPQAVMAGPPQYEGSPQQYGLSPQFSPSNKFLLPKKGGRGNGNPWQSGISRSWLL